ncbi:Protein CBR-SRBC-19 [Caenorhabditis briggsae]|uniref:Serpentine Receptor, class BC (Class B-like) n=2 Tax=Caenorhabditis briggsae TaxID=6238 RepID=A0AAE9CYJ1_CAEBR|nr:Protein CBR-SRBC-19 [Caenorhabditis briggsae]ULT86808.1 hypothetical protein L3Y34_006493 [Caenorhabditis briggsae]CAP38549.2 Protein CBR-SRBC-19 [Caenorhabditis briggsae]
MDQQTDEQIRMNTSAVAISVVGIISSLVTCFTNVILLKTYMKKKNDMALFYYRFTLDVILGALVAASLLFAVLYSYFSSELSEYQNFIFYLSLPASNVGACRSIVTLSVAIERMVAAYAPIFFHNYRHRCPTVIILILAVIFGLTEDVVLYEFCNFHLNVPKNCATFGCAINSCFLYYWTTHKSTIFALNFVFSLLLCIKLFIINNVMKTGKVELSRANRLALIDSAMVFMFDFMPSFIANQFSTTQFFSFQNIGPYGTVAKLLGCAVEAFLVYRKMQKGKKSSTVENSRTMGRNSKRKITEVRVN